MKTSHFHKLLVLIVLFLLIAAMGQPWIRGYLGQKEPKLEFQADDVQTMGAQLTPLRFELISRPKTPSLLGVPWIRAPREMTLSDLEALPPIPFSFGMILEGVSISPEILGLLKTQTNLVALDLTNSTANDEDLEHLGGFANLHSLNLKDTDITDHGAWVIGNRCDLRELIAPRVRFTDEAIKHLKSQIHLRLLDLSGNKITDRSFRALAHFSKLTHLSLGWCRARPERWKDLRPLTGLVRLELYGSNVGDGALVDIGELFRLTDLNLANTQVTSSGLWSLRKLGLQTLDLSNNQLGSNAIRALQDLKTLVKLDISGCEIKDDMMAEWTKLGSLEELDLSHNELGDAGLANFLKNQPCPRVLNLSSTQIGDKALEALARGKGPARLDLGGTKISNAGLASIAKLENLESLTLGSDSLDLGPRLAFPAEAKRLEGLVLRNVRLDSSALDSIVSLPELKRLDFEGTPFDVAAGRKVAQAPKLAELIVSEKMDSSTYYAFLNKIKKLKKVTFEFDNIHFNAMEDLASLGAEVEIDLRIGRATDDEMERMVPIPGLKRLDLTDGDLTEASLKYLSKHANLQELILKGNERFGSQNLRGLSQCKKLQKLDLNGTSIHDGASAEISRLTQLKILKVTSTKTGAGFLRGLSALKNLEVLYLDGVDLKNEDLEALGRLPALVELAIGSKNLTAAAGPILAKLTRLKNLIITGFSPKSDPLEAVCSLTKLETLILDGVGFSEASMKAVAAAVPLKHLEIIRVKSAPHALDPIGGISSLKRFLWRDHHLTKDDLAFCGRLGQLEHLKLNWDSGSPQLEPLAALKALKTATIHGPRHAYLPGAVQAFSGWTNLEVLHLGGFHLDETDAQVLARLPGLATLSVLGHELTDAQLAALAKTPKLTYFGFEANRLSSQGFQPLIAHPVCLDWLIEGVHLSQNKEPPGLETLASLPQLTELRLKNGPVSPRNLQNLAALKTMRTLALENCQVSDQDLAQLAPLKGLRQLTLSGNPLTGGCCEEIARWPHLRELTVQRQDLTPEVRRSLKKKRPDLNVSWPLEVQTEVSPFRPTRRSSRS